MPDTKKNRRETANTGTHTRDPPIMILTNCPSQDRHVQDKKIRKIGQARRKQKKLKNQLQEALKILNFV